MEHFNTRNASVVLELAELGDCRVQFDIDKSNIINADAITPIGLEALAAESQPPCAAVGPFDDVPAIDISTKAKAYKFPVTLHRGFNLRLLSPLTSPYTTQIYPDMITTTQIVARLLYHRQRMNYIAFVLLTNGSRHSLA